MDILKDVNEPQREAITHIEGPLLVLAGAGSGKTRVVTRRIAYLLSQGVRPRNILAITFTNKAANEMTERIRQFYKFKDLWVSTFHAFSARMLRRFADRFDYPADYSIYDTTDKTRLISRVLKEFELDTSQWSPSDIETTISLAKSKMVSAENFSEHTQGFRENMLARIYERYEQNLRAARAWDFDDLLLRMAELLSDFEEVRESLQRRFQFVLIDEFQDTNLPQYLIARLLGEGHRNICATGDPDQSIYAWRGANLMNIFHFERDFPGVKVVRLEENYRSTKTILQAASSLISNNRLRKHKDLWTDNVQGLPLEVLYVYGETDEAREVAEIISQMKEEGSSLRDFAIFYRINAMSRSLEEALRENKIPYTIVAGVEFYQRKEVRDVLAYLKLLANPRDDVSLERVINTPPRGIGAATRNSLRTIAGEKTISLLEAGKIALQEKRFRPRALKALEGFLDFMDELAGFDVFAVSELISAVVKKTGYREMLKKVAAGEEREANVDEFIAAAAVYDEENPQGSLHGFLEQVALIADVDDWDDKAQAVSLMTLHSAKGLEFPVVFIIGLEEGLLPHRLSSEDEAELEEERRLFFVGMTRARERLFISYVRRRSEQGRWALKIPSRFLREIPEEVINYQDLLAKSHRPRREAIEEVEWEGLKVGDWVSHEEFGSGRMVAIEGRGNSARATVDFEDGGKKRLMLKFAGLKRID